MAEKLAARNANLSLFSHDACDVTLSVYPHRASLKNMPDHGGNRTYDLWNASPMLCQLSYASGYFHSIKIFQKCG